MARIVVGVTGASGSILALKLIEQLLKAEHEVHLVLSKGGSYTAIEELGPQYNSSEKWKAHFPKDVQPLIHTHPIHDFGAPIASGSFEAYGMVIVPCSMASLAACSISLSDNLIRRSADVTLKERRPLVIVPREMPYSEAHLENMLKLTRMGAIILPPSPAWYTHPKTLHDVEMSIVGRILDALKLPTDCYPRWQGVKCSAT